MTLTQLFTNIANAIRNKKGTSSTIIAENFPTEISSIQTGITPIGTINITQNGTTDVTNYASANVNVSSGGSIEEKDVNFYDYDGTLLHSYSKTEFLALTVLPENPIHTGLVAQGWNWDLADAKNYVTDYDELNIGQIYTTASGLSEFDIELTTATGLNVTLNMNGTKNWGDGTSDTNTSHTYTNYGNYTITCDGTTLSTSYSSSLCGTGSGTRNYYMKNIRLTNVSVVTSNAFMNFYNLKNIILSNSITRVRGSVFYYSSINFIVMPNLNYDIDGQTFNGCQHLKKICLSKRPFSSTATNIFGSCTRLEKIIIPDNMVLLYTDIFSSCILLEILKIPKSITSIGGNCFQNCHSLLKYDFSKYSNVPTLSNTSAFKNINNLAKIIVPDSLYSSWITTTNWVDLVDYIIKESDYNAS